MRKTTEFSKFSKIFNRHHENNKRGKFLLSEREERIGKNNSLGSTRKRIRVEEKVRDENEDMKRTLKKLESTVSHD